MSKFLSKKIAVLTAVAAVVIAATAFAYLTAGGSGTGAGGSSETLDTSMTLTAETPDIATLPGSDVIDISASNEGSSPQRLTGLTVTAAVKAGLANCPTGSFTVSDITPNNAQVPAGATAVVGTAKINFVNVDANQNGCLAADSIALTLGS